MLHPHWREMSRRAATAARAGQPAARATVAPAGTVTKASSPAPAPTAVIMGTRPTTATVGVSASAREAMTARAGPATNARCPAARAPFAGATTATGCTVDGAASSSAPAPGAGRAERREQIALRPTEHAGAGEAARPAGLATGQHGRRQEPRLTRQTNRLPKRAPSTLLNRGRLTSPFRQMRPYYGLRSNSWYGSCYPSTSLFKRLFTRGV